MAMLYSGQEFELREVVLKNKPQSMLDISPKGTVPVLQLENSVVDESVDVMRWALSQNDPDAWLSSELDHELVTINDGAFKGVLDQYKYFDRFPEHPQSYYFEQAVAHLQTLELHMVANHLGLHFLLNGRMSAIDVAIFPFIRQLAFVNKPAFDELNLPKLQQWLDWHLESNLFKVAMQKYPAWSTEQIETVLCAT
jgi:glutathione S-transferase